MVRRASIARVHDALLGGRDHYPVDRAALACLCLAYPGYREDLLASRRFLRTAVAHLAGSGIDQYLDLNGGMPTRPSMPELVRSVDPGAGLLRVSEDRTAYAHGVIATRQLGVRTLLHDVSDVAGLLARSETARALDLDRPVGVLCTELLHLLDDGRVRDLVEGLGRGLPSGSWLAVGVMRVGTGTAVDRHAAGRREVEAHLGRRLVLRSRPQVADLLAGLATAPTGLADLARRATTARPAAGGGLTTLAGLVHLDGAGRRRPPTPIRSRPRPPGATRQDSTGDARAATCRRVS